MTDEFDGALQCPRCSYDQSGIVATWVDRCPLFTLCPECGLEIDICQVQHDRKVLLTWWIEHAPGVRRTTWAMLTAPFLACVPWWLFKRLHMSHEPRFRRLLLPFIGYPILAYPILSGWAFLRSVQLLGSMGAITGLRDLLDILVVSFVPMGRLLATNASVASTTASIWFRGLDTALFVVPTTLYIIAVCAASAVAFAALPIARRRAKVRWAHVFRAGLILASSAPLVAIAAIIAYVLAHNALVLTIDGWMTPLAPFLVILIVVFLSWYFVARRHLQMTRPAAVAASVSLVGSLAVPALFALVGTILDR